jgi:hypothetical protein
MGGLQQTVGQGTFSVIDMGDNTKITNMLHELAVAFRLQN